MILKLGLIRYEVDSGSNIFLQHDCWHPDIVLYNKYGHRVVYDAASKPDSKLSSVLRDGNGVWNLAHSNDLAAIHSKLSLVRLVEEDRLLWIPSKSVQLMTSET